MLKAVNLNMLYRNILARKTRFFNLARYQCTYIVTLHQAIFLTPKIRRLTSRPVQRTKKYLISTQKHKKRQRRPDN